MGIDMSAFKMIYKDKVYNCLNIMPSWTDDKVGQLEIFYINEDNRVTFIIDDVSKFQFISR